MEPKKGNNKPAAPKDEPKKDLPAVAESQQEMMAISTDMPAHVAEMGRGDEGNENVGKEDLAIPRLEIVQGLSPAVTKGDPGFIEGASQGMFNNSASRELYGDKVYVINVYYDKQYLVWRDRKKAKELNKPQTGFFGAFPTIEEANARMAEEGGEAEALGVIETPQHMVLLLNRERGVVEEIILSMPRTKAKVSRQWNTLIRMTEKARYARIWELSAVIEERDGDKFYNFAPPKSFGYPSKALLAHAQKIYEQLKSGDRKIVMDTGNLERADPGEGAAAGANTSKM